MADKALGCQAPCVHGAPCSWGPRLTRPRTLAPGVLAASAREKFTAAGRGGEPAWEPSPHPGKQDERTRKEVTLAHSPQNPIQGLQCVF